MKSKVKVKPKANTLWKRVLFGSSVGIAVLIGLVLVLFGIFNIVYANTLYPRIYIAGQNFGRQNPAIAKENLKSILADVGDKKIIITSSEGKSWTASLDEINYSPSAEQTIEFAYSIGRKDNWLTSISEMVSVVVFGQDIPIIGAVDSDKISDFVSKIAQEIDIPEQDASLSVKKGDLIVGESNFGSRVDQQNTTLAIKNQLGKLIFEPVKLTVKEVEPNVYIEGLTQAQALAKLYLTANFNLTYQKNSFKVDNKMVGNWINFSASHAKVPGGRGVYLEANLKDDKLAGYLKTLSKQINQPARDAKLTISSGRASVFAPSQNGLEVDEKNFMADLKDAVSSGSQEDLIIPVIVTKPQVSESSINNLGIDELIGEATTSFAKSPDNRIHNILTGANFLNGLLIKPGETFSTVGALGKIDDTTGYLPELVIKENKTQPEFGGGLCQVSTTLFRSTLNAGLPIVERSNHSWRISYYEPPVGLDATIYLPKPDLKFKNDTPGWILIQNNVDVNTKKITFQLYGTKDGRNAKIIGPTLLYSTSAGDNIYVDDPTLPQGQEKQIQKPHPGGKATATYQVFDKTGKKINEQTFVSIYKSAAAQYLRGTGPAPEPPPADQPAQ